MAPQKETFTK